MGIQGSANPNRQGPQLPHKKLYLNRYCSTEMNSCCRSEARQGGVSHNACDTKDLWSAMSQGEPIAED